MLPQLNKKLVVLIIICPLLIIAVLYVSWLSPLQGEVERLESELNYEAQMLEKAKMNVDKKNEGIGDTTNSTIARLPMEPSIDELVLLFREAELNSKSTIESIDEVEVTNNIETTEELTLPAGVSLLSYQLTVKAQSYIGLTNFIQTLDEADRITMVTSSNITSENGFNITSGEVRAELNVVAYYFSVK
jgi:hypothetical protein